MTNNNELTYHYKIITAGAVAVHSLKSLENPHRRPSSIISLGHLYYSVLFTSLCSNTNNSRKREPRHNDTLDSWRYAKVATSVVSLAAVHVAPTDFRDPSIPSNLAGFRELQWPEVHTKLPKMSGYNGRRAPNFSQYLDSLNAIPSPYDQAVQQQQQQDSFNIDAELALFTNTEFFDFDKLGDLNLPTAFDSDDSQKDTTANADRDSEVKFLDLLNNGKPSVTG